MDAVGDKEWQEPWTNIVFNLGLRCRGYRGESLSGQGSGSRH